MMYLQLNANEQPHDNHGNDRVGIVIIKSNWLQVTSYFQEK